MPSRIAPLFYLLLLIVVAVALFPEATAASAKRTTPWSPVSNGADIPADGMLRVVDDQGRAWITTFEPIFASQDLPYVAFIEGGLLRIPSGGLDGYVDRLVVDRFRGGVVAQGRFVRSGSQPVRGLAHWNGAAWMELGGGLPADALVTAMALDASSGDVFIAGRFTTLGGVRVEGVARWSASSGQWTALPTPPFDPDHLAWDAAAGTLVAAGNLFDDLAVLSAGTWASPRLQNGDAITIREVDDLVAVSGQGVYVSVRTRAFGPPSAFRGEPLFRVSGVQVVEDPRVRGFFGQVSWDQTRNEMVLCCGRADGMPDSNVALRVSTAGVSALPDPYSGFGPWEGTRVAAGGGKTFAAYGRANALEFASLEAAGWVTFGNSVDPQQGQPVWNPVTRELFVRSAGTVDLAVRSGNAWTVVEPLELDVRADAVRSAGADGTVIAGQMTSDRLFVGRWRQGRWLDQRLSPGRFSALQGVNDVVWDVANQRYLIAGNLVISEGGAPQYHHVIEVDASGWRPIDVGVPADGRIGRVFGLEVAGCPDGVLAYGDLTQWGEQVASGAGCLVGRTARPYAGLPQSTVFATVAGPGAGVRHFWMAGGILRRDANGDRYVGKPEGGTALVRDLIADEQTRSLVVVGSFLGIDGVRANSVARLTRFGWMPVQGVAPHADLRATWIEDERRLVAGSVTGESSFPAPAVALAQARINLPPRITAAGNIYGTPEVGQTLTYSGGTAVDGDAVRLQWRWLRDGAPIAGATGTTYTVQRDDRGRSISAELTATDDEDIDRLSTAALVVVNRPPSQVSGRIVGLEDDGLRISLATFGTTASDPDRDPLELTAPNLPVGWRVDRVDAVTLNLLPASGYVGELRLPISLCDDLRACTAGSLDVVLEPRLMARADRFTLPWGAAETLIDVLANDLFVRSRLVGGRVVVLGVTGPGQASVDTGVLPADAADDRIRFRLDQREVSESRVSYLLCESDSRRCSESVAVLTVDAFGGEVNFSTSRDRGHHDIRIPALAGRSGLRVEANASASPHVEALELEADPSPSNPWDDGGTAFGLHATSTPPNAPVDIHVVASATPGTDVDLYLGIDANGDGRASPDEVVCAALSASATERCDLRRSSAMPPLANYWVLVHARTGPTRVRLERHDNLSGGSALSSLTATAPASAGSGAELPVRFIWNAPTMLPGDVQFGQVRLVDEDGRSLGRSMVRISRSAGDPVPYGLRPSETYRLDLAGRGSHAQLYVDVPPGLDRLVFEVESDGEVDLRAVALPPLRPDAAIPVVSRAPAADPSHPSARTTEGRARLDVAQPAAGRWFLVPTNRRNDRVAVFLTPRFESPGPMPVQPGGYFNLARSGSGLFVYPAGGEAAALWYTYDSDGRPRWYYLQGLRSSVTHGWSGRLFRSTWYGQSNRLVDIGRGSLMPNGSGGVTFSYSIDGESGTEAYSWFGGGCPQIEGRRINASGHWFDPVRAGSGYSIQLFPNYEFYLAFLYDARGESRFLVAESPLDTDSVRDLTLRQTSGACPFCAYGGMGPRVDVGRFRRTFVAGELVEIDVQADFADGVTGRWRTVDRVIPLAGAPSLQGCELP